MTRKRNKKNSILRTFRLSQPFSRTSALASGRRRSFRASLHSRFHCGKRRPSSAPSFVFVVLFSFSIACTSSLSSHPSPRPRRRRPLLPLSTPSSLSFLLVQQIIVLHLGRSICYIILELYLTKINVISLERVIHCHFVICHRLLFMIRPNRTTTHQIRYSHHSPTPLSSVGLCSNQIRCGHYY